MSSGLQDSKQKSDQIFPNFFDEALLLKIGKMLPERESWSRRIISTDFFNFQGKSGTDYFAHRMVSGHSIRWAPALLPGAIAVKPFTGLSYEFS